MFYFFTSCISKAFEVRVVNQYAIVSRITANNVTKVESTVYCTILNHKKKLPIEEFEYRYKNISSKCTIQTGMWCEEDSLSYFQKGLQQ
jgi:hypothetical protein